MKKKIYLLVFAGFSLMFLTGCNREDPLGKSQIDTTPPKLSELDAWIREKFITPYNIDIQYLWNENEADIGRTLYPPKEENVKPILEILLKIWVEPYNKLGDKIIKRIAPRQFTLIGGYNYNPSGTRTLGVAEGGVKITLFNVNQLDFGNEQGIKQYFKTVQHEYTHILNQIKPYDPLYGKINPEGYTASWFNSDNEEARQEGFITAYAKADEKEDFAEMVSEMLTHTKAEFDVIIDGDGLPGSNKKGIQVFEKDDKGDPKKDGNGNFIVNISETKKVKAFIREKEALVVAYFKEAFDIDFYELQRVVDENTKKVITTN